MKRFVRVTCLTLIVTCVVFQSRLPADVGPLARWIVDGNGFFEAVEHDGKVYLGGAFTHLYRANTNHEQVVDAGTGALVAGCARSTDPLNVLRDAFREEDGGGLFVPTPNASALVGLVDVNGPFQPSSTTRFLRIQADCTFDRNFEAPAPNPSAPSGTVASIFRSGSIVLASTAPLFGTVGIAAYDSFSGQRLAFRSYTESRIDFLGSGPPGTVIVLLSSGGNQVVAHLSLTTLDIGITSAALPAGRRYWNRAGRVFMWEPPPSLQTGDWLKPLEALDNTTLQPAAGWSNPVPHHGSDAGVVAMLQGVLDLEVVGGRVFIAGTNRVNNQALPEPVALNLISGVPDLTWNPPALSQPPGLGTPTPLVQAVETDGARVFFSAFGLGRVGSSERIIFAALDGTSGALDAWAPSIRPKSGASTPFHFFSGGVFVEGIAGTEGVARRFLAAVDSVTGALTSWNPLAAASPAFGPTSMAADSTHLYISTQLTGAVQRIPFATATVDTTWELALTRGLGAGARALLINASTLYMGGAFESIEGKGSANTFPPTTRRSAAAVSLVTGQLTAWNPNLVAPIAPDGVYAMAMAGTTVFIGGNFIRSGVEVGLLGVDATNGAVTIQPELDLPHIYSVTSDGTFAFAVGTIGTDDMLIVLDPSGVVTAAVPLMLPDVGSRRISYSRGRLYAESERDPFTLEPTDSPVRFTSAWIGTTGMILWDTDGDGLAYHPYDEPARPNPPQNFSVQTSGNFVTLSWSAPAPGDSPTAGLPSSYVIRAGSSPGLSDLANFDTGSLATTFSTPAPDGTYFVRIHARNFFGLSEPSNEVQVTVGAPPCSGPPGVPGQLVATVSGLSVAFTWGTASGATSYVLEAGSVTGGSDVARLNVGAATSLDGSAPAGVYYVRVRGTNPCSDGPASNELVVTLGTPVVLPGPPTNLAFTLDGTFVTLTWGPPVTGGAAASYGLVAGSGPGLADRAVIPLQGTELQGIAPPGIYYVRVHAINVAGPGPPSNEVIVNVP